MAHEIKYKTDASGEYCETDCPFNKIHPRERGLIVAVGSWQCTTNCPLFIENDDARSIVTCDNPNDLI